MPRIHHLLAALILLVALGTAFAPGTARAEKRIALVVGNAGYQAGALTTPANDAGLIAQTLQAAGFDVVGARDLDQDSLRRAFRDFLDKAQAAGPDTAAFVYLGGYGLQLEGENYFIPVDAKIARDIDLPTEAVRLSDYTRPLAALKLKVGIVVLDAARAHPFARSGPPLAGGLALVEPEPGMLIAFNATPGTVAPEGAGPYGPYAQALAEMMREGGLSLPEVFERVRLRVNDVTKGAEVAWQASKVEEAFLFFERTADAPPPAVPVAETAAIRARPIGELGAQDGYIVALERDTLPGYQDFLAAYPADPMAPRVRAIVAARREAITWRRARLDDTPPAYWTYLRRYPEGPHAFDARRRLAYLAAAYEPPPAFTALAYDVPPPPPEEIVYIRRPILMFDDPVFAFAPPPEPVIFLAPAPLIFLEPPPPPIGVFVLPVPVYTPVPVWVRPPVYVAAPPPNNVIYANIHNTVVINNATNTVIVTNPAGQSRTITPAAAAPGGSTASPAHAGAIGPALPPSVAQKAASLPAMAPGGQPGTPAAAKLLPGQPLPGAKGQPLPAAPVTGALPTLPAGKSLTPAGIPKTGAVTPGAIKPGTIKSGTITPATPAAKLVAPTPPTPGSVKPVLPSTPTGSAKPSGLHPPAAKLVTPTPPTPPTPGAVKPLTPSLPSGAAAKPLGPPSSPPAAKLTTPSPPHVTGAIKPVLPSGGGATSLPKTYAPASVPPAGAMLPPGAGPKPAMGPPPGMGPKPALAPPPPPAPRVAQPVPPQPKGPVPAKPKGPLPK